MVKSESARGDLQLSQERERKNEFLNFHIFNFFSSKIWKIAAVVALFPRQLMQVVETFSHFSFPKKVLPSLSQLSHFLSLSLSMSSFLTGVPCLAPILYPDIFL